MRPSSLLPASWATTAAVSAGYTALLFKCLAEIAAGAAADSRRSSSAPPWRCWETYVIAALALSCAPAELHCLNRALQCGEAVSVVPTYLALGMLSQLATGAVFFRELRGFASAAHAAGFALGVLLTLAFVVAAAVARAQDGAEASTHHSEEEEVYVRLPDARTVAALPGAAPAAPEATYAAAAAKEEWPQHLKTDGSKNGWAVQFDTGQTVSIAGFGGAIECLDATRVRRRLSPRVVKIRAGSSPF